MHIYRIPSFLLPVCLLLCATIPALAQNFGSVKIGASTTATIPITISTAGTVGSISVRLMGAENLDFTNAGGGTCSAGTTYAANATCTVKVTFAPRYAGPRNGALILFSGAKSTGTALATVLVSGIGDGPQVAFASGTVISISIAANPGLGSDGASAVAVDGAGNLFLADITNSRVLEIPADGSAPTVISPIVDGLSLNQPWGVALDGAGDLFIADPYNQRVVKVPADGSAPTAIKPYVTPQGFSTFSLTVDGIGNIFAVVGNDIVKVPADGSAPVFINPVVKGLALSEPQQIAVDGAGDLFIADFGNLRMVEVPAGGGSPVAIAPIVDGIALGAIEGIAVDGAGDLFLTDFHNVEPTFARILEVPAGGVKPVVVPYQPSGSLLSAEPTSLTLDQAGNLFVPILFWNGLLELPRSQPPTLSFANTGVGSASADSPHVVQIQNIGTEPLAFSGLTYPADFPEATASSPCTASTSLAAGEVCYLSIAFTPTVLGALSEAVSLTDNTLNLPGSTQTLSVAGDSGEPQTVTFGALPDVTYGVAPITLTATASTGLPVTFTATGPATVSGNLLTITGAGTVVVTATQAGNATYGPAYVVRTFAVAKPVLTVTAHNASRGYGGPNPVFFDTITGFVNGENLGVVSGAASLATTATPASPVGSYPIVAAAGTLHAANYSFAFVNGTLTVTTAGFGSFQVGATTSSLVPVTVATVGKVGSISVRLMGAENLDFTNAGGGTCSVGTTYAAKATCTVNVKFAPKYAGARNGAIVLFSGAGNTGTVLASVPIFGIGIGPQITFGPAPATAIDPTVNGIGLTNPDGVAVDGAGNLFIVDEFSSRVVELPANGDAPIAIQPTVNGRALYLPAGVAVDGAGNLLIVDGPGSNRVVEVPVGGGAPIAISPGLFEPLAVAVDGTGNLFIADYDNGRVVEVPASDAPPVSIDPIVNGKALFYPTGVAVDGTGNLFIADYDNGRVVEVPASGAAPIAINPSVKGLAAAYPYSIAVDGTGNLFVGDYPNNRVIEVPVGGTPISINPTVNGEGLGPTDGIALDSAGNLFIVDARHNRVVNLQRSQPPSLSFAKTGVNTTSADSPQVVQIQNSGNQPLAFSGLSYATDFPEASGASLCTASTSLDASATCNLSVAFTPTVLGSLSEKITLTDNTLNLAGSRQNISVSGSSEKTQTLTFAALPNVDFGTAPITLTATATSGLAVAYSVTGPATLSGSTLTITGGGPVSVTASQPGDSTYLAAPPVTRTFTVLLSSKVAVHSSPVSATLGWPVTFTATASGAGATPTGTITFLSGSTSLGTASLSSGVATLTTSTLALGSHSIRATYGGSTVYTPATSAPITQLITSNPTLALTATPNPVDLYAALTLTATVENPTGSALPTGQVKFFADFQPLGLATLTSGVATFQISTLSVGEHYIEVEYLGDANYKYMRAVVLRVWVGRIPVTVSLTSSANPLPLGSSVTFTATLAGTLPDKPVSGSIHFYRGNVLLGTGTLSGNAATFTTSTLPHGLSTITAQYWGDTNYLSTNSPNLTQIVQ